MKNLKRKDFYVVLDSSMKKPIKKDFYPDCGLHSDMEKPNRKDFYTNCGLHSAMNEYAKSKAKTLLQCKAEYKDGTQFVNVFERITKEIPYKCIDGEIYHQDIDTGKFDADFLVEYNDDECMSSKRIKELFTEFVKKNTSEDLKITFEFVNP